MLLWDAIIFPHCLFETFFVTEASRDRIVLIPVNFDFLNKTLNSLDVLSLRATKGPGATCDASHTLHCGTARLREGSRRGRISGHALHRAPSGPGGESRRMSIWDESQLRVQVARELLEKMFPQEFALEVLARRQRSKSYFPGFTVQCLQQCDWVPDRDQLARSEN